MARMTFPSAGETTRPSPGGGVLQGETEKEGRKGNDTIFGNAGVDNEHGNEDCYETESRNRKEDIIAVFGDHRVDRRNRNMFNSKKKLPKKGANVNESRTVADEIHCEKGIKFVSFVQKRENYQVWIFGIWYLSGICDFVLVI
ncbi:MAG: hypothetical protein HYW57_09370 [Ignavibacteriales bacterium]|nr:hypothetical protein [Ignavibacteriales bacterium]